MKKYNIITIFILVLTTIVVSTDLFIMHQGEIINYGESYMIYQPLIGDDDFIKELQSIEDAANVSISTYDRQNLKVIPLQLEELNDISLTRRYNVYSQSQDYENFESALNTNGIGYLAESDPFYHNYIGSVLIVLIFIFYNVFICFRFVLRKQKQIKILKINGKTNFYILKHFLKENIKQDILVLFIFLFSILILSLIAFSGYLALIITIMIKLFIIVFIFRLIIWIFYIQKIKYKQAKTSYKFIMFFKIFVTCIIFVMMALLVKNIYDNTDNFEDYLYWESIKPYISYSAGMNVEIEDNSQRFDDMYEKIYEFYKLTKDTGLYIYDPYIDDNCSGYSFECNGIIVNKNYQEKFIKSTNISNGKFTILIPNSKYNELDEVQVLKDINYVLSAYIGYEEPLSSEDVEFQKIEDNYYAFPYNTTSSKANYTNNIILVDNNLQLPYELYTNGVANRQYIVDMDLEELNQIIFTNGLEKNLRDSTYKITEYNQQLILIFQVILSILVLCGMFIVIYIIINITFLERYFAKDKKKIIIRKINGKSLRKRHLKIIVFEIVQTIVLLLIMIIFLIFNMNLYIIFVLIAIIIIDYFFTIWTLFDIEHKNIIIMIRGDNND